MLEKNEQIGREDVVEQKELSLEQQEILSALEKAKWSEARVRTFATLVDTYGLDALIGLVFPWVGDASISTLSGLYLLYEANKAGLSKTDQLKIAGLQGTDFFIGAFPVVGDFFDYFFQANRTSHRYFEEKTQELIKQARINGISETEIAKITEQADKLPPLLDHAIKISEKTGIGNQIRKLRTKMRETLETNPQV